MQVLSKPHNEILNSVLVAVTLRHASEPVDEDSSKDIEDDKGPHDAKVAPGLREVSTNLGKEGIGSRQGAELTVGGIRIQKRSLI